MRRAVRQGPRLHAGSGDGAAGGRVRRLDGQEGRRRAPGGRSCGCRGCEPHDGSAEERRREGLRREVRGMSPARGPGPAAGVPGARAREDRHRPARRRARHRPQRQQGESGHGRVEGPAHRRGHRVRRHLCPQRLRQRHRRRGAARPGRGRQALNPGEAMENVLAPNEPVAAHEKKKGLARWISSTNHKEIGTLYLVTSLAMFFVGGIMALLIRLELFQPGLQFMQPELFNQLGALHALIMIFGAVTPALIGFSNWMLPLMIGAPDMAFPRLNNMSFWLIPPAALLLLASFFVPGGATAAGWTFYPPLSVQMGPGLDMAIFAVHLLGISSIAGAINIIVTILNMRAPGMTLMKMPMFCWTWLVTAYLLIMIMPVLAGAVTMLLFDRHFGTHFFNAAGGGDPVMFQHIFWFFGHPEVYVLILPVFGIISQIIPTFARKPLFGYRSIVIATLLIAVLSISVWAHHMFAVGMPAGAQVFFMYST